MNKETIQELYRHKEQILFDLKSIENILKQNNEEEYHLAVSHYIPQIATALEDIPKWLPRGQYTLQQTISKLEDSLSCSDMSEGLTRYI